MRILTEKQPQRIVLAPAAGDEPEEWILLAPITTAMRRRAQGAARRALGGAFEEASSDQLGDAGEAAGRELIRLGAIEWGGIAGSDGKPIALTPDRDTRFATASDPQRPTGTIDLLLDDEDAFEKLNTDYVWPDALRRAEKNGLSVSPNGTGEAATPASATASSRAARNPKRGAKSAPTAPKRSKPRPVRASGRP